MKIPTLSFQKIPMTLSPFLALILFLSGLYLIHSNIKERETWYLQTQSQTVEASSGVEVSDSENLQLALDSFNIPKISLEKSVSFLKPWNLKHKEIGKFSKNALEFTRLEKDFKRDVNSFLKLAQARKWPTLSKSFKRLNRSVQKSLFQANLNYTMTLFDSELERLNSIVKGSRLTTNDKARIQKDFVELGKYLGGLIELKTKLTSQIQSLKPLLGELNSEVSTSGETRQESYFDFVRTSDFVTLLILLVCFGFYCLTYFKEVSRTKKMSLMEGVETAEHVIIRGRSVSDFELENEARKILVELDGYLKKRLSFGQIFQEGIPFPALIISEGQEVLWHNQNFISEFEFSKDVKFIKSWDEIQNVIGFEHYFDLHEIFDGMISSIFQTQIKTRMSGQVRPFQLYVCPTEIQDLKYCFLYFYPLSAIEETIREQVSSTISPIENFFGKIEEASQKGEHLDIILARREIRPKFELVGIENIFDKMERFYSTTKDRIDLLLEDLSLSEEKSQDFQKEIHDFEKAQSKLMELNKKAKGVLTESKSTLTELVSEIEETSSIQNSSLKDLLGKIEGVDHLVESVKGELHDKQRIFELDDAVQNFKNRIKDMMVEAKSGARAGSSMAKFFRNLSTSNRDSFSIQEVRHLSQDLESLPHYLENALSFITQLNVFFSKFSFLIQELEKTSEITRSKVDAKTLESLGQRIQETQRVMEMTESRLFKKFEGMVGHFQKMYQLLKLGGVEFNQGLSDIEIHQQDLGEKLQERDRELESAKRHGVIEDEMDIPPQFFSAGGISEAAPKTSDFGSRNANRV